MAQTKAEDVRASEGVTYLVGYPIAHSLSPLLQNTVHSLMGRNWRYYLRETRDLDEFLRQMKSEPRCQGSGVTMPFKVAVIPHLDDLTPEGQAIGAVNTIFLTTDTSGQRRYHGTNTDCVGIREAIVRNVSDEQVYRGRPALIVGGGGTARAAVYALQKFLGCSPIYIVNRDKAEVEAVMNECTARGFGEDIIHVSDAAQAEQLETPGVIVSAVPDFAPVTEAEVVARETLTAFLHSERKGALLEMCYHPSSNTEITRLATAAKWQVIGGVEAMIGQGFEQLRLWSGEEVPDSVQHDTRAVIMEAVATRS